MDPLSGDQGEEKLFRRPATIDGLTVEVWGM